MANYNVFKNREKGLWAIKKQGSARISDLARTQLKAERIAKKMSGNSGGGEVRIHGLDGKIRDSDTVPPARDPFPPRDKKH